MVVLTQAVDGALPFLKGERDCDRDLQHGEVLDNIALLAFFAGALVIMGVLPHSAAPSVHSAYLNYLNLVEGCKKSKGAGQKDRKRGFQNAGS